MSSADRPQDTGNEDDWDESIRMKCSSGKSAAAGSHEGRRRIQEGGERLEQLCKAGV